MLKRIVDQSKTVVLVSLLVLASIVFPHPAVAGKAMKSLAFDGTNGTLEVFDIYETSYAAQKGIMKSLKTSNKLMKKASGFKGLTMLQSQNGKQVITLSQWQDLASYQAYTPTTADSSQAATSALAPPAPTHTLTFEVAAIQTSINGTTPALRGKEAVMQIAQFTAKGPNMQSQILTQVQAMIPNLLKKQPIPQSIIVLKELNSGEIALLNNWNCSAMFEDVGNPTSIESNSELMSIANSEQQIYNVVNIIPAEVEKDKNNKFDN